MLPRLDGRKIAVVLEHKFIPDEIQAYRSCFGLLGAEIEFLSRLWYGSHQPDSNTFFSDIDPNDDQPWQGPQSLMVCRDISNTNPDDYAAVIMSANYTSVRLRYTDLKRFAELTDSEIDDFDAHEHVKKAPVVQFFARAMANKEIVKGLLCHGLWILTPNPLLLRDRKVICHTVVMADVINCGARIKLTRTGVVVDDDLVTGFSKHEVLPFVAAIAAQIVARS